MEYVSVSQYAKMTGKDPGNIRRLLIQGILQGEKIGNQWVLPRDTEYPQDRRVKSGQYQGSRKYSSFAKANPKLSKALREMCEHISRIYGDALQKIVLYGSYARGEQTEDSDVDIAVILREESEAKHDAMVDVVVDYELQQGLTLSVVSVDSKNYQEWKNVLPYYQNLTKEGIVLWKEV